MVKTIKKSLAIVLALAVCLSVICVPASATASTSANDFPYMLCNYENDIVNVGGGTIVEGGVGGSGHALQVTFTAANDDHLLSDKMTGSFNPTIPAGSTLRVSFWVKLSQAADANASFTLLSYQLVNAGQDNAAKLSNPSSTDWQKVTINYTAATETVVSNTYLRSSAVQTLLIDDFEAMILPASVVGRTDQIASFDDYYASFEGDVAPMGIYLPNTGIKNATKTVQDHGDYTVQIVENPDGDGQVVKYVMDTQQRGNGSDFYVSGNTNTGSYEADKIAAGTIPAGATATIRFKYYLGTETSESSPTFSFFAAIGDGTYQFAGSDFDSTPYEWHVATLSYTNSTGSDISFPTSDAPRSHPLRIRPLPGWNVPTYTWVAKGHAGYSAGAGGTHDFGERTIYFDDMEMFITTEGESAPVAATPAMSTNFAVTGNVVEGNDITFSHTFTPASTSAADVTDKSVVRLVNYKANGEKAVIDYCGINETMTVPATPADSASMMFEVVPVGSDGSVGNVAEYAVPAPAPTINAISIERTAGGITVKTNIDLPAAKLIFVTYDANHKMTAWNYDRTVTLNAQGTQEFAIPEGFETAKVMLWYDMVNCKPLTDVLN